MTIKEGCQYTPNPEHKKSVCGRPAKYMIGWEHGKVDWIPVCGTHDVVIGLKNLVATGLTYPEAKELDAKIRGNK